MRSYTACTAAAEYCEQPQPKLLNGLLMIAPDCIICLLVNKHNIGREINDRNIPGAACIYYLGAETLNGIKCMNPATYFKDCVTFIMGD